MSEHRDYRGSIAYYNDAAEMEFHEQFWGDDGGQGAGGCGSCDSCCSGGCTRVLFKAGAAITCIYLLLAGIYVVYNAVSTVIWNYKERTAKEAYFDYVQTMKEEILQVDDYVARVSLDVDYGYKEDEVQNDYIIMEITLRNSFDELSIRKRAEILYEVDSFIMEKLAAAQEETGYIEILNSHRHSTYNKIDIEFVTYDYEYDFGSYETVNSRSYSRLNTYDRSVQYLGYVGYRLTWEDGEITSVKKLD